MSHIVVFVTAPNEEEAAKIARALVEEKLAACVNIIRGVRSIYSWQGKVEDEPEVLMVIKTREILFDDLKKRVEALHGYSVPEIIAMPVAQGSEEYLKWLDGATER